MAAGAIKASGIDFAFFAVSGAFRLILKVLSVALVCAWAKTANKQSCMINIFFKIDQVLGRFMPAHPPLLYLFLIANLF